MQAYLVRHGEAVSEAVDARRPLTERGRQQVRSLARRAASKKTEPAALFHSGILRAQETAELLRNELGLGVLPAATSGLFPEDDPFIAKAELDAAEDSIMLVGHLPHLQRLASVLVTGDSERRVVELAPATMVCLERGESHWHVEWVLEPGD